MSESEQDLLAQVFAAHRASVFRDNLSSIALRMAASGSRNYCNALVAALSTLGQVHGPITETVIFLGDKAPGDLATAMLRAGKKVPGWGNSFEKGHPDPHWAAVDQALARVRPDLAAKLEQVTSALYLAGKMLFPNPSAYTAAVAIALGIPAGIAPWLFVRGRLDGWTEMLAAPAKG